MSASYLFRGRGSHYFRAPLHHLAPEAWTIGGWIRLPRPVEGSDRAILTMFPGGSGRGQVVFLVRGSTVGVEVSVSGHNETAWLPGVIQPEEWYHVALSRDLDGTLYLIVNGQRCRTRSLPTFTLATILLARRGQAVVNAPFRGVIAGIHYWKKVLNSKELRLWFLGTPPENIRPAALTALPWEVEGAGDAPHEGPHPPLKKPLQPEPPPARPRRVFNSVVNKLRRMCILAFVWLVCSSAGVSVEATPEVKFFIGFETQNEFESRDENVPSSVIVNTFDSQCEGVEDWSLEIGGGAEGVTYRLATDAFACSTSETWAYGAYVQFHNDLTPPSDFPFLQVADGKGNAHLSLELHTNGGVYLHDANGTEKDGLQTPSADVWYLYEICMEKGNDPDGAVDIHIDGVWVGGDSDGDYWYSTETDCALQFIG